MTAHRVLVVEDEGLIAADITGRLEALGYTVVGTASTAEEAFEQAGGADIVLMDIRIDGSADGIDAAMRIRERYHLPVVFLTAQHADRSTLERAKLAAPCGYIIKPAASASLQTTIEIAIYKHHMERQLEVSEAWLQAALGSVTDAVIVTDPHGAVRTLNPAAETLLGGKPAAVAEFLSGDPVALAILEDAPVAVEARVRESLVEGLAAPVKSSGDLIGAVITLRDVSARRREQQRARQWERGAIAARLAAGVANDYTNLIAIIRNRSEQLLRQFANYSPVLRTLEEIQQAAAAADQITRRLAGIAAGQPGRPETLNLHGILRRMSRLIQSVAGERITVTMRTTAATGKIFADAAQTEELLMRLILHAVNAMPAGGQLDIETADVNDGARNQISLSVTHTGAGADLDCLDLAIAPYLTLEDDRRLEAFLPQWQEPEPAAGAISTLLLIEPRERIRAQLHNFFEVHGYNLLEAADDDQAKALLELQKVDLLIAATSQIQGVPRLDIAPPYTQQTLLQQVRSALDATLTFSASTR